MYVIRDKNGNIIQRSRNLGGIRRYVGNHLIKMLDISTQPNGGGKLCILFDDGASYEVNFACFRVLCGWVRRWRNTYGAPFYHNGQACGTIGTTNQFLKEQA